MEKKVFPLPYPNPSLNSMLFRVFSLTLPCLCWGQTIGRIHQKLLGNGDLQLLRDFLAISMRFDDLPMSLQSCESELIAS